MISPKAAAASLIALCLGLAVGRFVLPPLEVAAPVQMQLAANTADEKVNIPPEPAVPQPPETALAKLQAELDDARASQALLEEQLRTLAAKSRRYDYIREQLLKDRSLMALSRLRVDDTTLKLNNGLAEFLELSPSQTERLNALGAGMLERTKNWETANRVIIAQSDDTYTVELPPYNGTLQEDYREQMATILPAEDAEIVDSLAKGFFQNLGNKRQLQISITEETNGSLQLEQQISIFDKDGNKRGGSGTIYTIRDNNLNPFPEMNRWSHLYRITEDSE